jgi:hypothetical protein
VTVLSRRVAAGCAWLAVLSAPSASQPLHQVVGGCDGAPPERNVPADPSNYRTLLATLGPGDRLLLAPGTYTQGLPFLNHHGEAGRCIVVEGPVDGQPALFTGNSNFNTVSLRDSSYVVVRNLVLDGLGLEGDGVKAEGDADFTHHVTIENVQMTGYGAEQGRVGISTKCPSWSWVIRRNVILGAGTGLYLGDSNGGAELVGSLIEHNLIVDSIGYNAQIKHQTGRDTGLGIPADAETIVRHNVFAKDGNSSTGDDARPNLLVGHWPLSGAGSADQYLIYGNLFHGNPTGEPLFQGEGHVALYANLFVNHDGPAIAFQPHNHLPRNVEVFWNTVVASTRGLRVTGAEAGYQQRLRGNAVFSDLPIDGGTQSGNVHDAHDDADLYLAAPEGAPGAGLSLYPLAGALAGAALDTSGLETFLDWDRDFDGLPRAGSPLRGAYARDDGFPAWSPALVRKPLPPRPAADFYTLPPCRLLDTRGSPGITGGPALGATAVRPFPVAGRCGVPLGAVAVAANVTVVAPGAAGFVTLYPAGESRPLASTLNFRAGETRANNALLALSDWGEIAAYAGTTAGVHLVVDVAGYFR